MKYLSITVVISLSLFGYGCSPVEKGLLAEWKDENVQEIEHLAFASTYEDINSLAAIIGDAQIACLGESRHDLHEQFKLKTRFVRYMVEELGFTTFALEASLPYSNRLNDYILYGKGDLEAILSGMPGWFIWDTEELKELFEWLREHNQQSAEKVTFYGFDIVAPGDGLNQIFDYLSRVDPPFFAAIKDRDFARDLINDNHWPTTLANYEEISPERHHQLRQNFENLYQVVESNEELYRSQSTREAYDWILKLAYSAREANRMFSTEDMIQMGLTRDGAMANITSWIKSRNGKTIIWAHNVHIAKSAFTMSPYPESEIKGMGNLLFQEFQDEMVVIGAAFGTGAFQEEGRIFEPPQENSIDGAFSLLALDYVLVDLRKDISNEAMRKWLQAEQVLRGQEFEMYCVPVNAFDAFFYTDKVTKVHYNPPTLDRLNH